MDAASQSFGPRLKQQQTMEKGTTKQHGEEHAQGEDLILLARETHRPIKPPKLLEPGRALLRSFTRSFG